MLPLMKQSQMPWDLPVHQLRDTRLRNSFLALVCSICWSTGGITHDDTGISAAKRRVDVVAVLAVAIRLRPDSSASVVGAVVLR